MQTNVEYFGEEMGGSRKRNWSSYNLSHTSEKIVAMRILNDAVNSLGIPYDYDGIGRPPIPMDDMIKCCILKVYNCFSSRHTTPDLAMANALGYLSHVPHFNIVSKYLRSPEMTGYLHKLYITLAVPLKEAETTFAADATGFGTFKKNWQETKGWFRSQKMSQWKEFKKLHIICGVKTNIVTSAKTTEGHANDSPFLIELMRETAKRFDIKYMCADAGYLSKANCEAVKRIGAQPLIKPKKRYVEKAVIEVKNRKKMTAWREMLWFWDRHNKLFRHYYHKRSNVESTFSVIKRRFLPYLRSKDEHGQYNEMLCKVVCHNLSVLVNSIFELNLESDFKKAAAAAS